MSILFVKSFVAPFATVTCDCGQVYQDVDHIFSFECYLAAHDRLLHRSVHALQKVDQASHDALFRFRAWCRP